MTSWCAVRPLRMRGRHEHARTTRTRSRSAAITAGTGTLPARCTLADSSTVRYAITSYGRIASRRRHRSSRR
ncbi:hypothetical protein C6Q28_10495 [Burkholderia multivorans]|nr:hypothetical protein C6Q28_10495 [Burkholderia multivorans]